MLGKIYIYNSRQNISKFDAGISLHAILRMCLEAKDFLLPVTEPRRLAAANHYSAL